MFQIHLFFEDAPKIYEKSERCLVRTANHHDAMRPAVQETDVMWKSNIFRKLKLKFLSNIRWESKDLWRWEKLLVLVVRWVS